jgi:hypothetical protein
MKGDNMPLYRFRFYAGIPDEIEVEAPSYEEALQILRQEIESNCWVECDEKEREADAD